MRIMMAPVPESAQLSFGRPARSWPGSVAARSRKTFRPPGHPWLLLAAGLVLLHLGQPLAPGADTCRPCGSLRPVSVSPWPPGSGPRHLLLIAADVLLVRTSGLRDRPGPVHGIAAADAGPRRLERPARMCGGQGGRYPVVYRPGAVGAWTIPRSATLFLFLVPGLCGGSFAAARALPFWLLGPAEVSLGGGSSRSGSARRWVS